MGFSAVRGPPAFANWPSSGSPPSSSPCPSAKDNHQYWNAKTLADSGAAILLPQSTTTPEVLSQSLGEWLDAPQAMEEAARRLGDFAHPQATAQAIDAIQEVLEAAGRRP